MQKIVWMIAILSMISSVKFLRDITVSIGDLNTRIGDILERMEDQDDRLEQLEAEVRRCDGIPF
jgi:hypothetical protein